MQLYPLKLFPSNANFNFMGFSKISYFLAVLLITFCTIHIFIYGFNFGIDFVGGIAIEARSEKQINLSDIREKLTQLKIGEVVLQNFTDSDLSIKIANGSSKTFNANINLIKSTLSSYNFDYRKIDFVGPQMGMQLIKSSIIALALSFLAIMLYIWIRFEWYFGIGVLISLIHDAILTLGIMSILKLDFNLSTIAAILTIIGYSVNDSVVIYDRIRENLRKITKKNISQIINISINETLSRTILTVLTTLLANLALIILGGEAVYSFSVLVFCGIIIGTYSSIFISAPIVILFSKKISLK